MTIEFSNLNKNFERNMCREIERKFVALDSSQFDHLKTYASDITQLYLSHPDDEYSLRLRKVESSIPGVDTKFTATLKNRGELTENGLVRMEVETPITEQTFQQYAQQKTYPVLHKQRAELCEGVTIDWIEGGQTPIIEVEHSSLHESASQFLSIFSDDLLERTGHTDVDNESIAYALHDGEIEAREQTVSVDEIVTDMLAYRQLGAKKLVIGIGGRSGSGKSTLARELQTAIAQHPLLGEASTLASTDDYHRGRRYLEETYGAPWTNWEDARVYDTAKLAEEIAHWQEGQPLVERYFDFTKEEPVRGAELPPSDILIVEGIHASSKDLAAQRQMYYEVHTPLSTSLGRDIQRLLQTDRQQAAMKSPEERLRYMLETGEPTYQTIEQAPRNRFSASIRPLGARALSGLL